MTDEPDHLPGHPAFPHWLARLTLAGHGAVLTCLLFLITGAVFFPSLRDDFVAWDDDHTFYLNPHIQGLDAGHLRWMLTDVDYSMRYKPLSWLAYALIWQVNGMNPLGFHLLGWSFHCLNAVLVFVVLRRLLRRGFAGGGAGPPAEVISLSAAVCSLLWAVHPLRVEAVARATDITYGQTLFFTLISLWCYLRAVAGATAGRRAMGWYAGAIAAFAFAMFSYPFVLAFAVVLVVLDFYPLRRFPPGRGGWYEVSARGVWLEKIPFFLLAGVVLITFQGRLHPGALFADEPVDAHFSYFSRAMQAFYVWAYYVWRPWMPFGLSPVYVALVNFNPWGWQFVASAAGVIGLTGLLIWKRRVWAPVLGLWICHLALLVPALGLTEHPHYASDRYSHVDGVLWVALIAAGCVRLSRRRNPAWLLAAVLAVDALFGALSVRQIRIWRDTPTLFNYMADQLGNHPYRISIRLHLGTWYLDHGRVAEAAGQFERAVAEAPNSSNARDLFGETLFWLGRTNEAVFQLREAVRLSPNYLDARRNLALTLAKQGKPDEAVEQAGAALKLAPNNPDVEELLAVLLCNQNRLDEAIDHFRAALKIQPGFIAALNGLGVALFKQGRISEAVSQFQRALQLKPDDAEARENLRAALQQKPSP